MPNQAFLAAWKDACYGSISSTLLIPKFKTFLLNYLRFEGPCKYDIHVQVDGNIKRPNQIWNGQEYWIIFHQVTSLSIMGSGEIDGQGSNWWSCKENKQCPFMAANSLVVMNSKQVVVDGLRLTNSPMMHLVVGFSSEVTINNLQITAPGNSPNTDGIHIEQSYNVTVSNSVIGTGDDCVSISNNTYNVNVNGVTCGPGHGISIGSLGAKNSWATSENIHIKNCNLFDTTNGLRIKTWQVRSTTDIFLSLQFVFKRTWMFGGYGYAKAISFENIKMTRVYNPIIIDQHYCNGGSNCQYEPANGGKVFASCVNAYGTKYSVFPSVDCLRG
ncbi:putative polygalacturonase [Canna indica]|uniref:Polygalacturonase n=1 Tax=Canna indica TaxID=4628 RepID=A0AAQ3KZG9_9LILI|nr:putative polygalacturonase [Canna indica]